MTLKSWMIVTDGENNAFLRVLLEDDSSHYAQLNRRALLQLANHCISRAQEMESS